MLRPSFSVIQRHRWFSTSNSATTTFRVAIVGSGPSACYTAKYLPTALRKAHHNLTNVHIDILERLPTPYGLVRYGVAPDHPEVKNVQGDFDALFGGGQDDNHPTIRFWGNVSVGRDVTIDALRQHYHAVVLAAGCESDHTLQHLPGYDDLQASILSARSFVNWYNGHPEFLNVGRQVDAALHKQSHNSVCVIGQGNVALDCARVWAKGRDGLYTTDLARHALDVLGNDRVTQISIVGRRGHVQGAFTIKEVRELVKLADEGYNASLVVRPEELTVNSASQAELSGPGGRPKQRLDKLLREAAVAPFVDTLKQVRLRFLLNPVAFEADPERPGQLGSVVCERTRLEGEPHHQVAVGTGEYETIPAQLALVSIGYKAVPLPGLEPWFQGNKLVHQGGRVDTAQGTMGGLYAVGWYKRGPSGIIGTNIMDAKDTVATVVQDVAEQTVSNKDRDLASLLGNVAVVDWEGYQRIVQAEDAGKRSPKQPREKIVDLERLIAIGTGRGG